MSSETKNFRQSTFLFVGGVLIAVAFMFDREGGESSFFGWSTGQVEQQGTEMAAEVEELSKTTQNPQIVLPPKVPDSFYSGEADVIESEQEDDATGFDPTPGADRRVGPAPKDDDAELTGVEIGEDSAGQRVMELPRQAPNGRLADGIIDN